MTGTTATTVTADFKQEVTQATLAKGYVCLELMEDKWNHAYGLFHLPHNPNHPFVTWYVTRCSVTGNILTLSGCYFQDIFEAVEDFKKRVKG